MNQQRIAAVVRSWGETAYRWSIQIVFPETCAGCGISGTWMCAGCAENLLRLEPSERVIVMPDPRVASGSVEFRISAAYQFDGPVRRAIHLLKYRGQSARAEWCATEIARLLPAIVPNNAVLVPVPLFHKRQRQRRFNQAAEIARRLSDIWRCEYADALVRVRETRPQVELSGSERLDNVRGAFQAAAPLARRRVILVDDVVTTGATLRECAMVCLASGASGVTATVLAGSDRQVANSA